MSDVLRTPDRRVCERCGRTERDEDGWQVAEQGDIYCIHEWDIDGEFVPVQDAGGAATAKEC